jgi:hypothetical protein
VVCRYCFGGQPLWAREVQQQPGTCAACGGPGVYEMQLMPPLLYFLQQAYKDLQPSSYATHHWEWSTVIVSPVPRYVWAAFQLLLMTCFTEEIIELLLVWIHQKNRNPETNYHNELTSQRVYNCRFPFFPVSFLTSLLPESVFVHFLKR